MRIFGWLPFACMVPFLAACGGTGQGKQAMHGTAVSGEPLTMENIPRADGLIPKSDPYPTTVWHKDADFGFELGFPGAWRLTTVKNQDSVAFTLLAPGYAEGQPGKKLDIKVVRFGGGGRPYSFLMPTCPKELETGALTVSGMPYTRCRLKAGKNEYRVALTRHEIYFEFIYASASLEDADTKLIEGIIQCFKIVPRPTAGMKAFGLNEKFTLRQDESARLKDKNLVITNKGIREYSETKGDTGEGGTVLHVTLEFADGSILEGQASRIDPACIHEPLAMYGWQGYAIHLVGTPEPYGTVMLEVKQ